MKAWAPNGYDVVEWPQGRGLVPEKDLDSLWCKTAESYERKRAGNSRGGRRTQQQRRAVAMARENGQ